VQTLLLLALIGHALLHLLGPAKAFGLAALPQLTQPISKPAAMLWLLAAAATLVTAAAIPLWPQRWWLVAAIAIPLSQAAIATSWQDAKFGTIPNLVLLTFAVIHFART
jgi:signal transduction histidine kinase